VFNGRTSLIYRCNDSHKVQEYVAFRSGMDKHVDRAVSYCIIWCMQTMHTKL